MDAAVSAEAVAAQATNALETETARFGLERDRLQTELAAARSEALRLQGALASGGDSTTVADLNTQLTMKTGEVAMLTSQLRRMESVRATWCFSDLIEQLHLIYCCVGFVLVSRT